MPFLNWHQEIYKKYLAYKSDPCYRDINLSKRVTEQLLP